MTKQEKTQEAYGKHWKAIKDYVDKNGRLPIRKVKCIGNLPDDFEVLDHIYVRPKSLQGIENNNGWTKIDSKDDLPKDEENSYFVKTIYSKEILERDYPIFTKSMSIEEERKWWLENITHYQLIVKPREPLY